jgi:hypothetical protein
MIKYIHGSHDSIDIDVYYVFDIMPEFKYCQDFCSDKDENRNIITIKDGVVNQCFKGTVDEVNNGLFYTYNLHKQDYPLLITKTVQRDVLIKDIRAFRGIFSYLSRTQYRQDIKDGLKSGWGKRINIIENIDWNNIKEFHKTFNKKDVFKVYAFQLGQALGLHDGDELYTKKSLSEKYPDLRKYLYREDTDINDLLFYLSKFINMIKDYKIIENGTIITFCDFDKTIELKTERYMEV